MISSFGQLPDGRDVPAVTIETARLRARILGYGASLQSLTFDGAPMVLGSDVLGDYLGPLQYAGAIVGRVANRIAGARAVIGGAEVQLDANEANGNCLHGGREGSGQMLWSVVEQGAGYVVLSLHMPDGHMGFPAALEVQARYEVFATTLRIEITATSEGETLCSFAPHGYWNLSGGGTIDRHEMQIAAERYLPVNASMIPTGKVAEVAGTGFDFRTLRRIDGAELDHTFCLSREREDMRAVLWLRDAQSGVSLEVASTEPGVQVYDGRHFNVPRAALAIEPQNWPDAVNQTGFPPMTLAKGQTYRAVSEFRLSRAD